MFKQLFMLHKGKVYVVCYPQTMNSQEGYNYAREQLNALPDEITPWQEVKFSNGCARFDFDFLTEG